MGDVYENCRENPDLVKIGKKKYWLLHKETQACCILVSATLQRNNEGTALLRFHGNAFNIFLRCC